MRNFLGLLLFFWTIAITSTWSANERISFIPSPATQLRRQKFRRIPLFQRRGQREFQRLLYLKHLLELNCLKYLCNNNYCKPGQGCQNLFSDVVRPKPPIHYDQHKEDHTHSGRYYPDERMIYPPPTVYFINKPVNAPINNPPPQNPGVIPQSKDTKNMEGEPNQTTESRTYFYGKYVHSIPNEGETHIDEEKHRLPVLEFPLNNPGILAETDDLPKPGHATHDILSNQAKSNVLNVFRTQNRVGQYEVKEIVDEKPIDEFEYDRKVDAGQKIKPDEEQKIKLDEGQKVKLDEEQKIKLVTDKKNSSYLDVKNSSYPDVKNSKLKTTLKNLLKPFMKIDLTKETYPDLPHPTTISYHRNFSSHHFKEYISGKPLHTHHGSQKQPKMSSSHPYHGRGQKVKQETAVDYESNTAISNFSKFNMRTGHREGLNGAERFKSTTEKFSKFSYTPAGARFGGKKLNHTDFVKLPRQKAIEVGPPEPLDSLESFNFPDVATIADQQLKDYGFIPSERTVNNSTTLPESGRALTSFVTSSEIQTSRVISQGAREFISTRTELFDEPTDNSINPDLRFPEDEESTALNYDDFEYFSEATLNKVDFTTPKFDEYTDHPLLFDLFPEVRKDPDAKNSRKMHFEPQKTTKPNQIPEESSQRRSDILINDNVDYFDDDGTLSSSNYLEKLRKNSSFPSLYPLQNFTSDSIVPLIPIVINDLREGNISPEDIPLLSDTFGKHWPTVLSLSNNTNLDMLPLMKMKDEKDLENVLKSLLSEPEEATTTLKSDSNKSFYYDLYEYMDKDLYKDLYKDLLDFQEGRKPDLNFEVEESGKEGRKDDLLL